MIKISKIDNRQGYINCIAVYCIFFIVADKDNTQWGQKVCHIWWPSKFYFFVTSTITAQLDNTSVWCTDSYLPVIMSYYGFHVRHLTSFISTK